MFVLGAAWFNTKDSPSRVSKGVVAREEHRPVSVNLVAPAYTGRGAGEVAESSKAIVLGSIVGLGD